jgi:fatty-acyl-CoA synthase
MTETSPVSFQSATQDSLERRVSTVGRIHPHVEVKIIDVEGNRVPRGTSGELCTRGYSVMIGYWGHPDQTATVKDAQGWMHSGDLATIDDEGYCNIVGRLKDMVIRGGENLYPRETEEFLHRHPLVRDVQVFGVPDFKYGEELCAWIILQDGAQLTDQDLRAYCAGKIAHHKIPRYIKFVDAFPLTVTGKVRKFIMRDLMSAELGLVTVATA